MKRVTVGEVKIRFDTRLTASGKATCHGSFFVIACTNTKPNVTAINSLFPSHCASKLAA